MSDVLDCCGLKCPQPVLKAKKALKAIQAGESLRVRTDDPHALEDLRIFCAQGGHTMLRQETDDEGRTLHEIRKEH